MRILISGFKPFLKESINPSEKLAQQLTSEFHDLTSVILPVEFGRSFQVLQKSILLHQPDVVIMLGQAAGRKNVCLEKIGLNWVQSEYADEAGVLPVPGSIVKGSPLAYMTPFPVDRIYHDLRAKELAIEISFSAGTYVCNDLYFRVLNEYKNFKAVFVHVPLLPEQNRNQDKPTMAYPEQFQIVKELIHSLRGN